MRTVVITEYARSEPVTLGVAQRDALQRLVRGLTVIAEPGSTDTYRLTCGSTVGVVRVGDLTVELRPKIGVAAVLFLISYALDPKSWRAEAASLARDPNLAEAIVPLFVRAAQQAIRPGLLHGYRGREDTLASVRGRIRIAEQFRTRTGLPLPIEVSYDDFTPDILENRLLRTAVEILGQLYLRHRDSQVSLARLGQQLNGISALVPNEVAEPHWTRLNERYRPAVALARLIIGTAGLEARAGGQDASALLVNMNAVFETFVRAALGEALRLDDRAFPAGAGGRRVFLDKEGGVRLEPDLSWWIDARCVFLGDCKYKKTEGNIPNADVYQVLGYLTALRLGDGLLVYAAGEDVARSVTIPLVGKRMLVRTIDVSQPPDDVLAQVAKLAGLVRSIATGESAMVLSASGLCLHGAGEGRPLFRGEGGYRPGSPGTRGRSLYVPGSPESGTIRP